jgi:hypothetical protein
MKSDEKLGEAVSIIAALLDALDGDYSNPEAMSKLREHAEEFRRENWAARKEWWDKEARK